MQVCKLAIKGMAENNKYFTFTVPAWSHIWARVIQGCRGPCLGALLCRDEATSDSACSTLEAAIDVAWTEPVQVIKKNTNQKKNKGHTYCIKQLVISLFLTSFT